MDDDESSLFSDWKSGERSPVKVFAGFHSRYHSAGTGDCYARIRDMKKWKNHNWEKRSQKMDSFCFGGISADGCTYNMAM